LGINSPIHQLASLYILTTKNRTEETMAKPLRSKETNRAVDIGGLLIEEKELEELFSDPNDWKVVSAAPALLEELERQGLVAA
jgi:hypothetical protein